MSDSVTMHSFESCQNARPSVHSLTVERGGEGTDREIC